MTAGLFDQAGCRRRTLDWGPAGLARLAAGAAVAIASPNGATVAAAADLDASTAVPVLRAGAFVPLQ